MLPVVWSEKAKRNYAEIIDALSDKSVDAALKLDQQTNNKSLLGVLLPAKKTSLIR